MGSFLETLSYEDWLKKLELLNLNKMNLKWADGKGATNNSQICDGLPHKKRSELGNLLALRFCDLLHTTVIFPNRL